jgi:hypothetical protein
MKDTQVPQDNNKTYGGKRKLLYAVDNSGNYTSVQSVGWTVEEEANQAAVQECERLAQEAWQQAQQGLQSPLAYYLYKKRMDIPLLAQITGLFQWRIKRHLKPRIFNQLSPALIRRYCDALGLLPEQLQQLPPAP